MNTQKRGILPQNSVKHVLQIGKRFGDLLHNLQAVLQMCGMDRVRSSAKELSFSQGTSSSHGIILLYHSNGILNSRVADEIIKPFQSVGLMGERDIEKKLLDLPIPRFDNENFRYLKLANLGLQAEKEVGEILCEIDLPKPLGLKRKALREGISRTLDSIDEVVAQILVI